MVVGVQKVDKTIDWMPTGLCFWGVLQCFAASKQCP